MTPAPRFRVAPHRRLTAILATTVVVASLAAVSFLVRDGAGPPEGATVSVPDSPRIVFAEFGLNEDRIYTAPADEPDERTLHASVKHAPGWGLNPGASAVGPLVAYTVLPEDVESGREAPAELWVLDVTTDNLTRIARDADLLAPPVFVREGRALLYRRTSGTAQEMVQVDLDARTRDVVHREQTTFGIYPIGERATRFLFARLSAAGTDVYAVAPDGEPEHLFHASDDIARDWAISPDGSALSFLAPVTEAERVVYRARVVDLETLEDLPIDGGPDDPIATTEQYGPVWMPDGEALTVGQEAFTAPAAPAVLLGLDGSRTELPSPSFGFDVPLGWSADGRYLAARTFDGRNSVKPGLETVVIIDREGPREAIQVPSEVIFLGWYSGV